MYHDDANRNKVEKRAHYVIIKNGAHASPSNSCWHHHGIFLNIHTAIRPSDDVCKSDGEACVKTLDQLNLILKNLNRAFSVLGVSETWLTDSTAELVNITGYNFVSNHRKSKIGGGVGIYLQNDIEYQILKECKFSDSEVIESIFVEIIVPQGKNIIVGCVYRPPNQNTALFLEKFNDILTIITKDNKHCYVMGDFNLDLLQYNHHVPTQEFIFARIFSSYFKSNSPHLLLCNTN